LLVQIDVEKGCKLHKA